MLVGSVACRRGKAQEALQITMPRPSIALTVGETTTVHAVVTVHDQEAPVTVEWTSDNDAVARVDHKGRVTALSPGITGINARIGTAFATTRLSVSPIAARSEQRAAASRTPAVPAPPPPAARVARPVAPAATPAPRARATSSVGRRSRQSPHFSHISVFYTDFYSKYASPADRLAAVSFLAARLDGVMSGPRDQWKAANPTILHFPYALQYTVIIPGQKGAGDDAASSYLGDMQRWYAAHPQFDMENAFLHRGGHDQAHRVQIKIWDSMRWAVNPADSGQRSYQVDRLQRVAQNEDGVFLDEFGGSMSGVTKPSDEFATPAAYLSAETELIAQVHDAIKPKIVFINIAEYWTPSDSAMVVAGGGAHLERTNFPFTDRLVERWTEIDHLLAVNVYTEFVTLWSYTDWLGVHKHYPTFTGGNYDSPLERGQMAQLASYYMAVSANAQQLSYDQQNMWNVRPDTVWMPAVEVDVGHPREARHVIASGVDSAGQKYRIYARDFDHAYVLMRPTLDWHPQVYGDSTGVAVPLPAPMRPLHRDGTLGPAVSSVTLRNVEAVILLK